MKRQKAKNNYTNTNERLPRIFNLEKMRTASPYNTYLYDDIFSVHIRKGETINKFSLEYCINIYIIF